MAFGKKPNILLDLHKISWYGQGWLGSHYFLFPGPSLSSFEDGIRTNQKFLIWNSVDGSPNDEIIKDLSITYSVNAEQDHCIFDAIYGGTIVFLQGKLTTWT